MAEYVSIKGHSEDRRWNANGRGDLYLRADDSTWAIEFKQIWRPIPSELRRSFDAAIRCAKQVRASEADHRLACVIASLHYVRDDRRERYTENVADFAKNCDFAWQLGNDADSGPTFFMFKVI